LKPSLSSCVETDRDLVHADQLIAFFAVHDRLQVRLLPKGALLPNITLRPETREKGTPSCPR
jgi:hypothetical protein